MATTSKKMMITDVFVNGAFQGWNIATHSTIPNVLMAFVIIKMLNISGALDFIGTCLGPVMAIFGLPGEAAMILLGGWMSMGGGVGVAVALFDKGAVDGTQLAIVIPAIYLMMVLSRFKIFACAVIQLFPTISAADNAGK